MENRMNGPVLGVDIGGVIIDRVKGDASDTSMFSDRYLETPEMEGAIDAVAELARGRFGGNVRIVSKAGKRVRARSMDWLRGKEFFKRTGLREEDVHFCFTRFDKADICKRLGITHFVDDRCEVLSYVAPFVRNLVLFRGEAHDADNYPDIWPRVKRVTSWDEAKRALA